MEIKKSFKDYIENYSGEIIKEDLAELIIEYRGFKIYYDLLPITTAFNASQFTTRLRVLVQTDSSLKFHVKSKGNKLLNALNSKVVELDHEGFNRHYKCLSNDEKKVEKVFQNNLLTSISAYKNLEIHFVKNHEQGINCEDNEKCLLMTLPEAVLKLENMRAIIELFEQILDQLILTDHVESHNIQSNLI